MESEREGSSLLDEQKRVKRTSPRRRSGYSETSVAMDEYGEDTINVNAEEPDELKEELKKWLKKKYKIKVLNGVKILLEDFILLMLLISCVYRDNIFSLVFLIAIVFYMSRRKVKTMVKIAFIIGGVMVITYALALSNLHTNNNPMPFPYPFEGYPNA
jgi:hypothetical protein